MMGLEGSSLLSGFNKMNPIQGIYDNLMAIDDMKLSSIDPIRCPQIEACLDLMDSLKLSDLGLTDHEVNSINNSQCMNIKESESFEISAFILPQGCSIPPHNHPEMSVCSKVVFGSMRMQSFTPSSSSSYYDDVDASLIFDGVKSSKDCAWLLTPTSGNIHCFTAITTCVVFDVLMPPYEDPHRPCVFYKSTPMQGGADCKDYRLKVLSDSQVNSDVMLPYTVEYFGYEPVVH